MGLQKLLLSGGVSIAGHQRSPDQYKLPSIGRGGQGEARAEVSMEDEETEPRGRGSPKARLWLVAGGLSLNF